jgi:hypothetical protein
MNDLLHHYQIAKENANKYMKQGQLHAYFNALIEMNHYKKLMKAVLAN